MKMKECDRRKGKRKVRSNKEIQTGRETEIKMKDQSKEGRKKGKKKEKEGKKEKEKEEGKRNRNMKTGRENEIDEKR